MKAAVYYETGAPGVLRYEDVPDPALHPKGVLIDVKAIGIEGGDVLNRAGGDIPQRPHIVGYNCAGVVRQTGADVTDRKPGDRVTALMASGSHASMVSVPATSTWLVPDGVSLEEAACVPVAFGTAHDCVHEFGRVKAGESVLVQAGTSGVGIACVQIAKRAGATVIATSSSDEKLERLRAYSMDHGVNYGSGDFVARVRAITGGKGCDLIIDSVGGKPLVQIKPKDAAPKEPKAKPQSIAVRMQACLDIDDETKERLNCYDAIFPPKPKAAPMMTPMEPSMSDSTSR